MNVRSKIALTLLLTGLLSAVGVALALALALERFENESAYQRAHAFLARVIQQHPQLVEAQRRTPEQAAAFLGNLVLYEPQTRLYLLDARGRVLAHSHELTLPPDAAVPLAQVLQAARPPSGMPYAMGSDPATPGTQVVAAARALLEPAIRPNAPAAGYLYMASLPPEAGSGRAATLAGLLTQPGLLLALLVVAAATLLAAWGTAALTRPLTDLTEAVRAITLGGLEPRGAADAAALPRIPGTDSRDEFGQLARGMQAMLGALHSQWAQLRRLDHFRREAVSNLSHDLRSPLTAAAACLETLQRRRATAAAESTGSPQNPTIELRSGPTTGLQQSLTQGLIAGPQEGEEAQLLAIALRNTRQAAQLVHSLGELAQLDEPSFTLRPQAMDLCELVADLAMRFAAQAGARGLRLDAAVPAGPVVAEVDVELLERALANLVDNALKFCPAGGSIRLAARQDGAGVRLEVADDGPGIATAEQPQLFDRFYQSSTSATTRSDGGKGLGLAIVKRIAQLHAGTVELRSAPAAGTCVAILLPAVHRAAGPGQDLLALGEKAV